MAINGKKFFGLGKGLGSLIPESKKNDMEPSVKKENVFYVEVSKIEANPDQPRHDFDEDALKELAASVRKYGVLQPLLVSKIETSSAKGLDVTYRLIAGERRLRASKMAGLPHVPVIIRDDFQKNKERLEVALIENVQREDLNPIEQAEAYQRLSKEFGLTQQEISTKVGKSRVAVTNIIRLLNLPDDMKQSVRDGKIPGTAARALLSFSDKSKQRHAYQQLLTGAIGTREVEAAAVSDRPTTSRARAKMSDPKFISLERNLAERLETLVSINGDTSTGGRIVIKFASLEDLNKIAKAIID